MSNINTEFSDSIDIRELLFISLLCNLVLIFTYIYYVVLQQYIHMHVNFTVKLSIYNTIIIDSDSNRSSLV